MGVLCEEIGKVWIKNPSGPEGLGSIGEDATEEDSSCLSTGFWVTPHLTDFGFWAELQSVLPTDLVFIGTLVPPQPVPYAMY